MKKKFNIFNMDTFRQQLATDNNLKVLVKTYNKQYPEFNQVKLSNKWDRNAVNNLTSKNPITINRITKTAKLINPKRKILDFGVGYGDIIKKLSKENFDLNYTGIDISSVFINNLIKQYPNLNFAKKDIFKIKNDSYEIILALEIMEHIMPSKTFKVLNKINKILKKGGELVLSVPLFEDLKKTSYCCSKCGYWENSNGHVRSYTPELIKAELKLSGFEIIYEDYLYYPIGIKGILFKVGKILLRKKNVPFNIILKCLKV